MKIYLAGNPKTHFDRLIALRQQLLEAGHTITFDWLKEFEKPRPEPKTLGAWDQARMMAAVEDMNGVFQCEAFVLLDAAQGWGMYTEFGYALACWKRIVVIDPQYLQVFYHHPSVIVVQDETRALQTLSEIEELSL